MSGGLEAVTRGKFHVQLRMAGGQVSRVTRGDVTGMFAASLMPIWAM